MFTLYTRGYFIIDRLKLIRTIPMVDLGVEDIGFIFGPHREKTCLRGVRQSEFQTSLLSY